RGDGGVQEGEEEGGGQRRRGRGQAAGGGAVGLGRLSRHQHVARAGAGGDAARGDEQQSGASGVGGAASVMAGKPAGKPSSKTSRKPYRVGRSPTGLGLFATAPIEKGAFIVEYKGRRITNAQAKRLE